MVHGHEENVFVVGELYQYATNQRAVFQRKWCLCLLGQQSLQLRLAIGHIAQIVSDQLEAIVFGGNLLQCLPINLHEGRAQRCMPGHDAIQSALQRLCLQRSAQAQATTDVIRLTDTLELRQKPKPLLRKRQHARRIRLKRQNRRQNGSGRGRHTRCKSLERRMCKQLGHADLGPQLLTQARGNPHRQQ